MDDPFVPFSATELTINGKRAVQLVARDFWDHSKPKVVNLVVQQELPGFHLFPAVWEFLDTPLGGIFNLDLASQRRIALRVVAAPGVSVNVQSWPDGSGKHLDVIRIQDPEALPPQATSILTESMRPPSEANLPMLYPPSSYTGGRSQQPIDHFWLDYRSPGLVITHPYTSYTLTLDYPSRTTSLDDGADAKTRFCYQLVPPPGLTAFQVMSGYASPPSFVLIKTPNIKVTLGGGKPKFTIIPERYPAIIPFRVYEAPDITSVPPQGTDLTSRTAAFKELTMKLPAIRDFTDTETAHGVYSVIRLYLGFTGAGLIIDIAEFALAAMIGKDFEGNEVPPEGLVIMGLGVLMGAAPLSRGAIVKTFGRKATTVIELTTTLKEANVTGEERQLVHEAQEAILKGGLPTKAQAQAAADVVNRMHPAHPSFDTLLNAEDTGFANLELQEGYQASKARQIDEFGSSRTQAAPNAVESVPEGGQASAANSTENAPEKWAQTQAETNDQYSKALVEAVGPDVQKAAATMKTTASTQKFNILDIMLPKGFTKAAVRKHMKFILAQKDQLARDIKLKRLLKDLKSTDEVVLNEAKTRASSGRLSNVKGTIGEVFALPMQKNILQTSDAKACLFTNVKIKLATNRGSVAYTDNIIAILDGNDITIKVRFEVKTGPRGGLEATEQFFDWIERQLEEGDQLVIPKGSKYYDASGAEFTVNKEIRAIYGDVAPTQAQINKGVGKVTGMTGSDRVIIAAEGTSQLGLNSAKQTVGKVTRLELPLDSSQLDYLSGQLIQSLGKSGGIP
jgi:hypothetical protein